MKSVSCKRTIAGPKRSSSEIIELPLAALSDREAGNCIGPFGNLQDLPAAALTSVRFNFFIAWAGGFSLFSSPCVLILYNIAN